MSEFPYGVFSGVWVDAEEQGLCISCFPQLLGFIAELGSEAGYPEDPLI